MPEEQPLPMSADDTQSGADHAPMGDDEHAAALGFMTTLSEHMLSQDPEANPPEEMPQEPTDEEQPGDKDDEQDQEIADIRAELEKLLEEEDTKDDQETGDTETAE